VIADNPQGMHEFPERITLTEGMVHEKEMMSSILGQENRSSRTNAYAILGKVKTAMVKAGFSAEAKTFMDEATMGDYDHLLQTCCKYADVR